MLLVFIAELNKHLFLWVVVEVILGQDSALLPGKSHFVVKLFHTLLVEVRLCQEDQALS